MGKGIKKEERLEEVEILLVEDNPNDAELTLRALKKHNVTNKIVTVKDGAEALEFIYGTGAYSHRKGNESLKVILLDLKLPKVNGLEVLRRIKSEKMTKTIPVVVLTSSKEDKDIEDCYQLGVNSYIIKPVDFSNFAQAVSNLGLYWLLLNQSPRG